MGIEVNNLPLENIYNRRCGLIVVLPTKLEQPNGDICNLMRDIVNGYISLQEFKKISGLFEKERIKIRVEKEIHHNHSANLLHQNNMKLIQIMKIIKIKKS
jgi:hypothetical protein